jgi:hypothetical protein
LNSQRILKYFSLPFCKNWITMHKRQMSTFIKKALVSQGFRLN